MVDLNGLKASRKADRQRISGAFLQIAFKYGAEIEAKEGPAFAGFHGASIDLRGHLNGVGFMLDIDDLHERHGNPGGLLSWYNDRPYQRGGPYPPVLNFSPRFNSAVREYRGRPHHKASSHGSWAQLLEQFEAALKVAADGAAFQEREAA